MKLSVDVEVWPIEGGFTISRTIESCAIGQRESTPMPYWPPWKSKIDPKANG